jgi:hypothetical protein
VSSRRQRWRARIAWHDVDLLRDLGPDDGLLAAWTGQYRTDVFWVDDVASVREDLS